MNYIYTVNFDTQMAGLVNYYEYRRIAPNKKIAVEMARDHWHNELGNKAHMFHCAANRAEDQTAQNLRQFKVIDRRVVTWGNYKGR